MINALIFDWAGTLQNNIDVYVELCGVIFKKLGKTPISKEEIRQNITIPYMNFWNKYFPDMTLEKQNKLYAETIISLDKSQLYDGVKETLEHLSQKGIKLFVVSSEMSFTLLPEAKRGNLLDLFTEVIADVHEKEESIKEVIAKHNLDPEKTAYVGDTDGDIIAGKTCGVKTIAITWGMQAKEPLTASNPDIMIDDIKEILDLV
ncbi:HAD family hydrolase [Candidatus Woesearchaeota archaeon]|jgi:HAD superfamily hydrolase (TIGR01549 family)|nr:HAD family hydrolase [Candidatus Woesearchaeota archaeon]MBT4698156.1 HAD family hydrolase [Candidatus Woesearchaeota archaeon]MBT4716363.1 HAD family hydrolase [Candidatus Woesearchaeota archaeon]MBT7930295.1 HAD family hydrolase [Candidatus Woesearchaeota archaeon]